MICPQFRPIVGGYERAAERLAGALALSGHKVTVLTDRRESGWPNREMIDGFVVRRLPCVMRRWLHGPSSLLVHALWLMRHGRRFSVWHVHQYGARATLAILLGNLLRRPVVLKLTSSTHQGIATVLASSKLRYLHTWAHRRIDVCVAVSTETILEARAFGIPTERIVEIGNGVDAAVFCPTQPEERDARRAALGLAKLPTALFVGRLSAEKNPAGLLDAWACARSRFAQRWALVLVGDGPLRSALEEQARDLGIYEDVVFAGKSDRVEDWLAAADLCVLASHNEGLSNTTLEAMACGLPSIVTEVSGMTTLIGETGAGLIVPVGDMMAFADALVALHSDLGRRSAMGESARAAILRHYAVTMVAERYVVLYRSALQRYHG